MLLIWRIRTLGILCELGVGILDNVLGWELVREKQQRTRWRCGAVLLWILGPGLENGLAGKIHQSVSCQIEWRESHCLGSIVHSQMLAKPIKGDQEVFSSQRTTKN